MNIGFRYYSIRDSQESNNRLSPSYLYAVVTIAASALMQYAYVASQIEIGTAIERARSIALGVLGSIGLYMIAAVLYVSTLGGLSSIDVKRLASDSERLSAFVISPIQTLRQRMVEAKMQEIGRAHV